MTLRLDKKIQQTIRYQTLFWIGLLLFGLARNYSEHEPANFKEFIFYDVCHWIFQIIGANLIYFVLILQFLDRKKYVQFALYLITGLYGLAVLNRIFVIYIAEPYFVDYPKDDMISILTDLKYLFYHYILPLITGSFIFISVMLMLRYKNEKLHTIQQLQKEKIALELKALKSQLNPHFLFNTLNNIYSLSINNSGQVSQSISRLSDILDYILYKGQQKLVPITDELRIIDDFIALEKLRYDERLEINKFVAVTVAHSIPPLLYLSLVENAFKHGAEKTNKNVVINIWVTADEEGTTFKVENTFFEKEAEERTGIGLENIKQQLELYYLNQYTLKIEKKDTWFKVAVITPGHHD